MDVAVDFDQLTRVAIVAPHPDDESLGCGGLIARLRDAGRSVMLVFVSDGAASHPGSRRFPPEMLRRLREAEACEAAAALGLSRDDCVFLGFPDSDVPSAPEDPRFGEAVERLAARFEARAIDTVAVTRSDDPHPDHQASCTLVKSALRRLGRSILLLEYAIWAEDSWRPEDRLWRIDVGAALDRKRAAIACHRSQVTGLIDDVDGGARLAAAVLGRFTTGSETFRVTRVESSA